MGPQGPGGLVSDFEGDDRWEGSSAARVIGPERDAYLSVTRKSVRMQATAGLTSLPFGAGQRQPEMYVTQELMRDIRSALAQSERYDPSAGTSPDRVTVNGIRVVADRHLPRGKMVLIDRSGSVRLHDASPARVMADLGVRPAPTMRLVARNEVEGMPVGYGDLLAEEMAKQLARQQEQLYRSLGIGPSMLGLSNELSPDLPVENSYSSSAGLTQAISLQSIVDELDALDRQRPFAGMIARLVCTHCGLATSGRDGDDCPRCLRVLRAPARP